MRTADLDPERLYSTCDGHRLALVEPVHARWAKVKSDGNKPYRFVELDDDALPGKRTDPWGKCHTNEGKVGVRVRRWPKEAIDRNGDVRDGHEDSFTETVVTPADIAGTWSDYLVLHGATVRQHADDIDAKAKRDRYEDAVLAGVAKRLGLDRDAVSMPYYRSGDNWRVGVSIPDDALEALAGEVA